MNRTKIVAIIIALMLILTACGTKPLEQTPTMPSAQVPTAPTYNSTTQIVLADSGITVDGAVIGADATAAVYTANDIVYYESGKDFTYGEGSEKDAHSPDAAAAHTVVHITKPGAYTLSGKLFKGQIAVDLGEDAKEDPNAVVTLILNGVDITCEVAPAVIFYNVYECGNDDTKNATKDVDTSDAGANVIIADGTVNTVNGAYVERIYKPDSVVLNADKTEVEDADKLHKYDGAFYSKRSMNIFGGKENTGALNIKAENEGLDSEMHLTVNGGNINIFSGNDGINTNEDGVSVTTINGGRLNIQVTGETGEGDGIDSNGWLVINGGTVIAAACSNSADAGIDSDMGIHINGGTVIATGHMLDRIEDGGQTHAVFNFAQKQDGSKTVSLKDKNGKALLEHCPQNAYSVLVYSSPELKEGTYTLWSGEQQLAGQGGGFGGQEMRPGGMTPPEGFGNGQMPEGMTPPDGFENERQPPEGMEFPEGQRPPVNGEKPDGFQKPDNGFKPEQGSPASGERSPEFKISVGTNMFAAIAPLT